MNARKRSIHQNKAIHGLVARIAAKSGISREDGYVMLRRLTREVSGQESTRRLTEHQARRLIDRLRDELGEPRRPRPAEPVQREAPQGPGDTITPKQQRFLAGLYAQAGIDTAKRQQAFCRRQCGHPWPQSRRQVDQLVHALQSMILRGLDCEAVKARFVALRGHAALDTWQTHFVEDICQRLEGGAAPKKLFTTGRLAKLAEAERRVHDHAPA